MIKVICLLALITFASAQISATFTQVLISYGSQGVYVVPANVTDPDGTTYFDLQAVAGTQPDGQWRIDLINSDGSTSYLENQNNDLVVRDPNGGVQSVSGQIPPLLGITGPQLVAAVGNGAQGAVAWVYAHPDHHNITTAQANIEANKVVNNLLATSKLPSFFLTPFRAQAASLISKSLDNAQKTSAAINATLEAQKPPPANEPTSEPTTSAADAIVNIPLNLSSFNVASLNNISEIDATYGNEGVKVTLNNQTQAQGGYEAAWSVDLETVIGSAQDNGEWHLQWVDNQGNSWNTFDVDGRIVVKEDNSNSTVDWSAEAALWAEAENGDVNAAVGKAIEDFVDKVFVNANKTDNVVINVGEDGLEWNYDDDSTA